MSTFKPQSLLTEDGGSKVLRNFGILSQHYTVPQYKRPLVEFVTEFGRFLVGLKGVI